MLLLLLGPALMLVSCSSPAYRSLRSEEEIPELSAMTAKTRAVRNHTFLVPVSAQGKTISLSVHQLGSGRRERALAFVHGVFSDHLTWRFISGELARNYDLYLVDLPGCGDSEAAEPDRLPAGFLSPQNLAELTLQAIEEILRQRQDRPRIALVGHSLGGTAILQMFHPEVHARHRAAMSRVDRLVLLAPFDVAQNKPDADLKAISEAKGWQVQLAKSLGVLKDWNAKSMRRSMVHPENAPREEADRGVEMLSNRGLRTASQAMLAQAVPWTAEGRPDWPRIEQLAAAYPHANVPCLIVWGARDETLTQAMGYKLAAQLPQAKLVVVPEAMHSLHVEHPRLAVDLIREHVGQP
jgi:pimeloyl-ACP methyl ester carboxylesterase